MKKEKEGFLITIEGIDGSGKSTQSNLLAQFFKQKGISFVQSSEPTFGKWGKIIREQTAKGKLEAEEELNLFLKDRYEHTKNLILPSLEAGKIVLLDRYYFSSIAYQGARGIDLAKIRQLNEDFAPAPHLSFLLDISVEIAWERINQRGVHLDSFETIENLKKYREIFLSLTDKCIIKVDASLEKEKIQQIIQEKCLSRIYQLLKKN